MVSREWVYSEIGIRDRKKHDKTKETKLSEMIHKKHHTAAHNTIIHHDARLHDT